MLAGLAIRDLSADDPAVLSAAFSAIGWNKPVSLFETYLSECRRGERMALLAELPAAVAGYGTVLWHSPYMHFQEHQIPEIIKVFTIHGIMRMKMLSVNS